MIRFTTLISLLSVVFSMISCVALTASEEISKPVEHEKTFTFALSDFPPVDFTAKKRGVKVEDFVLTASLAQSRVAPEGKVILHILLKNAGYTDRVLYQSIPEYQYILYIEPPKGKPVTIDKVTNAALYRNQIYTLKPNEKVSDDFVVSNSYKFSAPGRYRITAARRIPGLNGHYFPYVVSNTVTLTVSK